MRVLGASHQLLVQRGDTVEFSETLACDLTGAAAMPGSTVAEGYTFASSVTRHSPAELAAEVQALEGELAADPGRAVLARFPGNRWAVTALHVEPPTLPGNAISWRTWHVYPNSGEIVATSSTFTPLANGSAA